MLHYTISYHSGEKFYKWKFFLIIISLVLVSIQIQAQNGWTNPTNLSTPRFGASASVVNGKIYVMGGEAANSIILANNEVYDPLTGIWDTLAPMPTPRTFLLTAVVNDTIYAIGGLYPDYNTYQLKVEAYDPITNTWTTKNNMPNGRIGQNAAVVDGIIYIEGGNYNRRECWAYNPSNDIWTPKESIPAPGGGNSSLTVHNGLIYAIGGSTYSPWIALPYVFAYNPQTDTWSSPKDSMPQASFGLQTYLVDELIYAVGGGQYDNHAMANVQEYDPVTDTWAELPPMPKALIWFAGAVVNNKIYVIGGLSTGWATVEEKVWEYYPIVPVELTSFTAEALDQKVVLKWTTATELNNHGFEIQRKVVGNDFATVGFKKGEGTTTNQKEYSYIDKDLVDGKYFYRLKQFDFNGSYEYSNVIEIDVRSLDDYALEQNYPNPFNPATTIGYVLKEKTNAKLILLNAIGEEMAVLVNEEQDKGFHRVDLNATNLSSGVYFYRLQTVDFVQTKKLILLK